MADGKVPYQDPATEDRSLASQTVARAGGIGGNVHREEVVIANGGDNAAIAEVLNAAPVAEYGLVVRNIPSGTQTVTGTVTATTGGLTDAQLRATAVPVSGTVTATGPLTDAQLRATPVPVSGTVTANLAAGSNNIGDVDVLTLPALVAGTANIGDVDVLTVPADPFGVNADAASATGSISAKLRFIAATGIPVTGSVAVTGPLTDAELRATAVPISVATIPSHAVTNAGTFAVQVSSLPATPAGSNNIGDVDVLTLPALVAGTANIGDVDVLTLPALVAGTANIGDVDVLTVPAPLSTTGGGTEATALRVTLANDSTGLVSVDDNGGSLTVDAPVGTPAFVRLSDGSAAIATLPVSVASVPSHAVTNAGVFAVQAEGNAAHDAVDSGNPLKVGHKAIAYGTNPTAVAAADRSDSYCNRAGIPFVLGGHPNVVTIEAAYTAAQTDTAIVTVAGGLKIAVTQIQMVADNANTVDVGFRVGFATATTPTTTGVVLTHPGVAAGSGVSRGNGSAVIGIGADGEDLRITSEVPTTGSIRILVSYFTIES